VTEDQKGEKENEGGTESAVSTDECDDEEEECDYEEARQARIAQKRRRLESLGITQAAGGGGSSKPVRSGLQGGGGHMQSPAAGGSQQPEGESSRVQRHRVSQPQGSRRAQPCRAAQQQGEQRRQKQGVPRSRGGTSARARPGGGQFRRAIYNRDRLGYEPWKKVLLQLPKGTYELGRGWACICMRLDCARAAVNIRM
jgi:hypothetical protein